MLKNNYEIVVPSKGRPGNMPSLLRLFPSAIIVVNKSEVPIYAEVVPKAQLVAHPEMKLIETRNWIFDKFDNECIIQFNDDVQKLLSLGVKNKTYRDPEVIHAVILNTMQCAQDLGIGLFCWSLTPNSGMLFPDVRPFRAAAPCSAHAFGVRGQARNRRFDTTFRSCGDFDFTLETLLRDRLLLCDVRWHFDCGGMSRGKGGESGTFHSGEAEAGQAALRKKWGKYVGVSAVQKINKNKSWRSFSVAVPRTNARAVN
jgi:hypothetical protein